MSNSWSIYIIVLVVINIIGIVWLLFATAKHDPESDNKEKTTGHEWDGLQELNMPLPKWWVYLFVGSIIFSVIYLVLYPGMGNFKGILGWTQTAQYEVEAKAVNEQYAKIFAQYKNKTIEELGKDKEAMDIAQRLFVNNCSLCHGSDARGAKGFPNLADNDWLYGGSVDQIAMSITEGRTGIMPAMGPAIQGDSGAYSLAIYLKNFSEPFGDKHSLETGKKMYQQLCVGCHSGDATGNKILGAPNLTDAVWLHGGHIQDIQTVIKDGKQSVMPSYKELLTEDEIHFLTAYIYQLSQPK